MTSAVEQQNSATTAVARNAAETLRFADAVSAGASEIRDAAAGANTYGKSVEQHGKDVIGLAEKLKMRVTIFLRQSEAGDRRRPDRLPCEIGVELRTDTGTGVIRGQTADLSEGGALVRVEDIRPIAPRSILQAKLDGIGTTRVRVAESSSLGLHLEFLEMSSAVRTELERKLASIREENREIISRAVDIANDISRTLEGLVDQGTLTETICSITITPRSTAPIPCNTARDFFLPWKMYYRRSRRRYSQATRGWCSARRSIETATCRFIIASIRFPSAPAKQRGTPRIHAIAASLTIAPASPPGATFDLTSFKFIRATWETA